MHFSRGFLKKAEERLANLDKFRLVIYVFLLNLLVTITFSIISVILYYTITDTNLMANGAQRSTMDLIISGVILAPLFETLLFQHLPYYLYKRSIFFRTSPLGLIIFPAIIFGVLHFNSILNIISAFFCSMVFMMCYISRVNNGIKEAYWLVVLAHALHNLFLVLISI